jgi:hypothetical protein
MDGLRREQAGSWSVGWGPNVSAAYLVQFSMFTWGVLQFVKAKKYKIIGWGDRGITLPFCIHFGGISRTRWCPHTSVS